MARRALPVAFAQDAAGPGEFDSAPAGAFCLAAGGPPLDELQQVLRRRETVRPGTISVTHARLSLRDDESGRRVGKPPGLAIIQDELNRDAVGRVPRETMQRIYRNNGTVSLGAGQKWDYRLGDGRAAAMTVHDNDDVMPRSYGGVDVTNTVMDYTGFVTCVYRTVLPSSWFGPSTPWRFLLARRWRWRAHISRGELGAGVAWLRGLLALATVRPGLLEDREALMISDSLCTVGAWANGRSGPLT